MKRERIAAGVSLALAWSMGWACDGRQDALQRQVRDSVPRKTAPVIETAPSHPLREQLDPVLSKVYALNEVPRIVEEDVAPSGDRKYVLEPGVAAVVKIPPGLSQDERVKAIVTGVAEADAWAFRPNARRPFAALVQRVQTSYGVDQKELILTQYAQLRLLDFFNSEAAGPAIAALPPDLQAPVEAMRGYYTANKQKIWDEWMAVKLLARRVVAGNEPFRGVLRNIKKELGQEEPPPLTWEQSMAPQFATWASALRNDEDLFIRLSNLRELREREEYFGETHARWLIQGSAEAPKVAIEKGLGFGVERKDLGGGFNELTFVFAKKLQGPKLKAAFIQSVLYAHLLHDFQMLSTAGTDFAERTEDNVVDQNTAIVPDKYVPLFAACGSRAAFDSLVSYFGRDYAVLADLRSSGDVKKAAKNAHQCVLEGSRGDIYEPPKGDDRFVEGPAPNTLLAFEQMLSRFEKIDVNLAAMADSVRTEEDEAIDDIDARIDALNQN